MRLKIIKKKVEKSKINNNKKYDLFKKILCYFDWKLNFVLSNKKFTIICWKNIFKNVNNKCSNIKNDPVCIRLCAD